MISPLIVVFLCLLLSFFFSASETALSSLGKLEIQTVISKGGWRARILNQWVREPSKILITILVGNNIANVVASSLFALWVNQRYSSLGVSLSMAVFTFALVFGAEIVPKLLARQSPHQMAPMAMRFLNVVAALLKPLIWGIEKLTAGFVFLSGRSGRVHRLILSEEDISNTIEMATKEGGLDRETGEVQTNLMEFPDRQARDIMTPRSRIQAVSIAWNFEEAMRFISNDGHSRYPVFRNSLDETVGVILAKDFLGHLQKGNPGSWTRLVRRPYFVSEMAPLGSILRDMKRWGTHLALVRNETGVLTGLLSMEDLLEEIVGQIRDEHDEPTEGGGDRGMGDPRLVSGEIPILDFNDRYYCSLPMDVSYSTLNGYLLSKTGGQIPPNGTLIFGEDITFRIHSVSSEGIATIEVMDQSRKMDD